MGIEERQYMHPKDCTCPKCKDDYCKQEEARDLERLFSAINDDVKTYDVNKDKRWCPDCRKYVKAEFKKDEPNNCIRCVCIICGKEFYKRTISEHK